MSKSPEIPRAQSLIDLIKEVRAPEAETEDGWVKIDDPADEFSPSFANSWDHNQPSESDPPAGFYLDEIGEVHFRGRVAGGSAVSVIFTLPEGYRPEYDLPFTVPYGASAGAIPTGFANVMVYAGGTVVLLSTWNP